jgi:uncharacterized protein YbjT (DUF2867 family)
MKILITGGTGFIGRALTRSLLEQSYEVSVLSRNPDSVGKHCLILPRSSGHSTKRVISKTEVNYETTKRINHPRCSQQIYRTV